VLHDGIADEPALLQQRDQPIRLARAEEEIHSGRASASSPLWRSTMHPTATTAVALPVSFSRPAATIASIDSALAASMKPQVLTMMSSASAASSDAHGAVVDELRDVAFAVDGVLVAAQGDDTELQGGISR
jgi:hypothetical protein